MKSTLENLNSRYSAAPWLKECDVVLVGLGAVGQGVGLSLLANEYNVVAYDFDKVSVENVIPQGYNINQIGKGKCEAFLENARNFVGRQPLAYDKAYDGMAGEVMISAVDNMKTRKEIFEAFLDSDAQLFIDARMIPCQFQVFCITKDEAKIEYYKNSLFSDDEVPSENCSFKSSRHTNQMIHGYITGLVCNYVTNRDKKIDIYDLPVEYLFNSNHLSLCQVIQTL